MLRDFTGNITYIKYEMFEQILASQKDGHAKEWDVQGTAIPSKGKAEDSWNDDGCK
jgi:hypothetical protein